MTVLTPQSNPIRSTCKLLDKKIASTIDAEIFRPRGFISGYMNVTVVKESYPYLCKIFVLLEVVFGERL